IPPGKLILYDDLNGAQQDLKRGEIIAIYVIEPDYLISGNVVVYSGERGIFSSLINPGEQKIDDLLRASLIKGKVADNTMKRVLAPTKLTRMKIDKRGQAREVENRLQKVTSMFVPLGMIILFGSIILITSGYLLHSTAQEKENRVMEILLASVKPSQLLAGKILGLSAVGFLQALVYGLLLFLPASFIVSIAQVNFQDILLSFVYVLLGYFLFASLMAGTGIIGNTVQESTQYSMIWSLISVLPIFFILQISHSPNSLLAKGFSYFPLTAPGTMILRIIISEVPLIDFAISMFALIIG